MKKEKRSPRGGELLREMIAMYKPQSIGDIQEMLKDMFADTKLLTSPPKPYKPWGLPSAYGSVQTPPNAMNTISFYFCIEMGHIYLQRRKLK